MLISSTYRALNASLHEGGNYGRHGEKWSGEVSRVMARYEARSVLDYGCGQGSLRRSLGPFVQEYDPAIAGKNFLPMPTDLVVCTDVLEHIEPECLAEVLDHLRALSIRACFVVVSTRAAKKFLADGRNAHLIVENDDFWREHFSDRFTIAKFIPLDQEFAAVLEPLTGLAAIRGMFRAALRPRARQH
jgi:hypothetical protein